MADDRRRASSDEDVEATAADGAPSDRRVAAPVADGVPADGMLAHRRVETPVADAEVQDELPGELDVSGAVGAYLFPNNSRRRVPGALYLLMALALVAVWALERDSALVNGGFLLAAGLLAIAGAYSLVSGWDLRVDERDALVAATAEVGFPVGHASAQMGWRGLLSRPTWRILLYSAENPPTRRALVLVDGCDGHVLDRIVEDNPEDWSELVEDE